MFPSEYKHKIFIAEHGSWNRKEKIGYRISLVDPEEKTYEIFADGWLQDEKDWGRPVDILIMPDGSILVSDDKAGLIYRISYEK
jgi:glucose/arabinose dehydrogenase